MEPIRNRNQRLRRRVEANLVALMVADTERVPETNESLVNDSFLRVAGDRRDALEHGETGWGHDYAGIRCCRPYPEFAANSGGGHGSFRRGDGS